MATTTGTACRLTIPMRLTHGPPCEDHATLWFRHTGLMVEVLDLDARDLDPEDDARVVFALGPCDALGLGLTPEDFVDGVVLCHDGDGRAPAWACTPVLVVGTDEERPAQPIFDAGDALEWLDR